MFSGPLAYIPASVTGIISSALADPSWPDIYIHQTAVAPHFGSGPLVRVAEDALGIKRNVLANYIEPSEGKDAYYNGLGIGRPYSRGLVTLRSKDPFDKPLIDPKYYSDRRDADVMIEGTQFPISATVTEVKKRIIVYFSRAGIRKILRIYENAPSFRKLNATLANGPLKGCDKYTFGSTKYWDCYVRTFTLTAWHPCCTCPMQGRKNAGNAVVDSELR